MATYKIRKFTNGKNRAGEPFTNYSLTVPAHVAKELPDEVTFVCELSEDGILFRPVEESDEQKLPSWAQKGSGPVPNGNGAKAAAKSGARKAPAAKAEKAEKKAPARKAPAKKAAPKAAAKLAARKAPAAKKPAPKSASKPSTAGTRPRPGAKKAVAA